MLGRSEMRIVCQTGIVVEIPGMLEGSELKNLDLHRAILERASFSGTTFDGCGLRNALFPLSVGRAARFLGCSLILTEFQAADLQDSHFEGGDAAHSDFAGANLAGAAFVDIRLESVSFRGSNLDRSDFSRTAITGALLEGAIYSPLTRWPEGFDPEYSGAILVGGQTAAFRFLECEAEASDGI